MDTATVVSGAEGAGGLRRVTRLLPARSLRAQVAKPNIVESPAVRALVDQRTTAPPTH
jgi:hypothetical protein